MVEIKTDCIGGIEELHVYTIKAEEAEEFAAKIMTDVLTRKEWVNCSSFMPVVLSTLHYTFTITGGYYR